MAKRKVRAKVEAVKAWGHQTSLGSVYPAASSSKAAWPRPVRVVILRESDYRRLLKAAKGKP